MIEVKASIYEVADGEPTVIEYDDILFVRWDEYILRQIPTKETSYPLKGKVICVIGTQKIYENIVNHMKKTTMTNKQLRNVLRRYYKGCKRSSLDSLMSGYKKYFKMVNNETL